MKITQYIILTLTDYTSDQLSDIDKLCETFLSHAKYNKDNTKVVMKVMSNSQGIYNALISSLTMYNSGEIKLIMKSSDWIKVSDPDYVDEILPIPPED
jgi:hypothetical protein